MESSEQYGNPGARQAELDVVRAVYDAFARRDVEAAIAHLAETIEFHPAGTVKLTGRTGPYVGHAGVREYFADAAAVWDDLTLHAEDFRIAVGGVIVFGRVDGVVGGETFESRAIWVWQVRGDKAVSMRAMPLDGPLPY